MPEVAAPPVYDANYAQDRAEIEDLMARYLFAIDYHDFDTYASLFTEDGELEFASGTAKGREDIKATVARFAERIASVYKDEDGNPAVLRHLLAQAAIRIDGDRAWVRSLWYEMANDGPGKTLKMGTFGLNEDEMARVGGRWLFAKRRILNEFLAGRQSGPGNPVRDMDSAG